MPSLRCIVLALVLSFSAFPVFAQQEQPIDPAALMQDLQRQKERIEARQRTIQLQSQPATAVAAVADHPYLDTFGAAVMPVVTLLITGFLFPWLKRLVEARMGDRLDAAASRLAPDLLQKLLEAGVNVAGLTVEQLVNDPRVGNLLQRKGEILKANYPAFSSALKQTADSLGVLVAREAKKIPQVVPQAATEPSQDAVPPPREPDMGTIADEVIKKLMTRQALERRAQQVAAQRPVQTSAPPSKPPVEQPPVDLKPELEVQPSPPQPLPPMGAWDQLRATAVKPPG